MNTGLQSIFQNYIHLDKYARWRDADNRRETWRESVDRYVDYMRAKAPKIPDAEWKTAREVFYNVEAIPSMRALMTAGPALDHAPSAGFNCAALAFDHMRAFDETLYLLMVGCGVGFSVERQFVSKLPEVAETFQPTDTVIMVADSKEGWAAALRELISLLYQGQIPKWDVSKVRPYGSRLKVFGGRASGPTPLVELFKFCVKTFQGAAGRTLTSIEVHDIVCKIGECVVCGGVRRSALISLSNPSDERMQSAKSGDWRVVAPWREMSNNSSCYTEKPTFSTFCREWLAIYSSHSGERGIFNRAASQRMAKAIGRDAAHDFLCNPCSETVLRSMEKCNLSEVVVRAEDTEETLRTKIRVAVLFGTVQSSLTNFKHLRRAWKKNCEEERLLGTSMTGIADNVLTYGGKRTPEERKELRAMLKRLRAYAWECNAEFAGMLGINKSAAITCVKPSGTASLLARCSSGIHASWSRHYIRRVKANKTDPLAKFMASIGVPAEPDVRRPEDGIVFTFPVKSPDSALVKGDLDAIEQLELWLDYQVAWCDHKPSCTVYIRESEWMRVGAWVYDNFDMVSGVAFFPEDESDTLYEQLPYTACTKEEFEALDAKMPKDIDMTLLAKFENGEHAAAGKEMACAGGACELAEDKL